jgi:hypothetical protein
MSPQAISSEFTSTDMLPPLTFAFGPLSASRKASVPANETVLASEMPSKRLEMVSSSTG